MRFKFELKNAVPFATVTTHIEHKKIQQDIVSKYCHHQNFLLFFSWQVEASDMSMKEQTLTYVPSLCISVCRHHWLYPSGSSPTSLGERESILRHVLPLSQLLHGVPLTKGWCGLLVCASWEEQWRKGNSGGRTSEILLSPSLKFKVSVNDLFWYKVLLYIPSLSMSLSDM